MMLDEQWERCTLCAIKVKACRHQYLIETGLCSRVLVRIVAGGNPEAYSAVLTVNRHDRGSNRTRIVLPPTVRTHRTPYKTRLKGIVGTY